MFLDIKKKVVDMGVDLATRMLRSAMETQLAELARALVCRVVDDRAMEDNKVADEKFTGIKVVSKDMATMATIIEGSEFWCG